MRRLRALPLSAALIAACASPAAAPSTDNPVASSGPTATTWMSPLPTSAPLPTPELPVPAAPRPLPLPHVAVERQAFPIGPIQGFIAPDRSELDLVTGSAAGVERMYGELWTQYADIPRLDIQKRPTVEDQFNAYVAPGPFADLLKGWLALGYADETKTVSVRDLTVERWYAKPWGKTALAEARFGIVIRSDTTMGTPSERRHEVRVRISLPSWRIIDVFDHTAARWVAGDAPRYSPLILENEAERAVAQYLWSESILQPVHSPTTGPPYATAFWKARNGALHELSVRSAAGLRDRHFEDVTVRIVRFDPSTYLGDGIVTVEVRGRLVEIDANDQRRVVAFTQPLRFLRTFGDNQTWIAADAQEAGAGWISGGDLALAELERTFG